MSCQYGCKCQTCAPEGIREALLPVIDDILAIPGLVGAIFKRVWFVKRTWYSDQAKTTLATQVGGFATDVITELLPTPLQKDYSQDLRLREGGMIKQGDIVLKNVSRNEFQESDLDGSSTAPNIEHFYLVGEKLYQVINLREKLVSWDVQLRELSNQTRY